MDFSNLSRGEQAPNGAMEELPPSLLTSQGQQTVIVKKVRMLYITDQISETDNNFPKI